MADTLNRAVTFRLYPTARQAITLDRLLESQRLLYNAALEERIGRWNWNREAVGKYDQYKGLTGAAPDLSAITEFGVRVHRGTLNRLDEAFAGFFRRVRAGHADLNAAFNLLDRAGISRPGSGHARITA